MKMNDYPKIVLKAAVLSVCCLMLMPFASADDPPGEGVFNFVTLSDGGLDQGVLHRWVMTGRGEFSEDDVDGEGEFNHFDGNSGPPPLTLLGSGTWEATEFISWVPVEGQGPNPYGQVIAGTLTLEINLFPDNGDDNGIPAMLTVVCNVPPAGNFTGLAEGIFLDIGGGLSFVPLGVGITLHTVGDDGDDAEDDDDDDSDSDSDDD